MCKAMPDRMVVLCLPRLGPYIAMPVVFAAKFLEATIVCPASHASWVWAAHAKCIWATLYHNSDDKVDAAQKHCP